MAKLNIKSALNSAEEHGADQAKNRTRADPVDPKFRIPPGRHMRLNGKLLPAKGLKWPFRNYAMLPATLERIKQTVYTELDNSAINYLINRGLDAIEQDAAGQVVDFPDYMEQIFQREGFDQFRPENYDGFYEK